MKGSTLATPAAAAGRLGPSLSQGAVDKSSVRTADAAWNVGFVAVGSLKSKEVVDIFYGRLTSKEKSAIAPLFPGVLQTAPNASASVRRKFPVEDGGVMFLASDSTGSFLFGVYVQDRTYPERAAFALLTEVQQLVSEAIQAEPACGKKPGLLAKRVRQAVRGLISKFDLPASVDKTAEVLKKVEDVKLEMEKNVQKVLQNQANLESLESKTDQLASSAKTFKQTAGDVNRATWWQKVKLTILLGFFVTAVVAYLVFIILDFVLNADR
ncbi:synaptobrevin protein [Besnoitia besnoiti]|uniref:Synaptobrevin protein n=1 Tax=Besnoitia besnoiti TaxID=94643 RepID=A0A2A9MC32_BESBE|nr:synaptobrevin protein [Besnoitia besnoiti]PFH33486.1 synaptobrevin protein [Besnoitia besnoiti]